MNVVIRETSKSDLPAVLGLYAQPGMDDGQVLPLERADEIFSRMQRHSNHALYVAVADQEVVGTFALLIMENLAHMGALSGIIEDVVVRPDWQRRGIGTAIMNYAIDVCKALGCYKLALSSNMKREAAHAFYESLGFQRHGYSFVLDLP